MVMFRPRAMVAKTSVSVRFETQEREPKNGTAARKATRIASAVAPTAGRPRTAVEALPIHAFGRRAQPSSQRA